MIRLTIIFLLSAITVNAQWNTEIMPLSEIRPGMTGKGKTVYYGTEIKEFGVEVLEIMQNLYPKFDVILVRLTGENAERYGIVSGMSGSPVYIDGKLIGALAMRFGQFMKEPIGAVMPIEHMLKTVDYEKSRPESYSTLINHETYLDATFTGESKDLWHKVLKPFMRSSQRTTGLQTILTPLVFSGFQAETLAPFKDLFQELGFRIMAGGSASQVDSLASFEPGSAVSILFVGGDVGIDATGTVTDVDGDRLLAFGHQIFNLGPIAVPLAHAKILTTLPSLMGSSKMAISTLEAGSFRQDRLSGALGNTREKAATLPISLNMMSEHFGQESFRFDMAYDTSINNLSPFFFRIALFQAIVASRLSSQRVSTELTGLVSFADGQSLNFKDFFSTTRDLGVVETGSDVAMVSDLTASLMGALIVNDFDSPDITDVKLDLKTRPGERVLKIRSIRQDKSMVDPGDSLLLQIDLLNTNGTTREISKVIPVPEKVKARYLTLIVGSGPTLTRYEMQLNTEKFRPYDFAHLLRLLKERRQNNRVYIQLRERDGGLVVHGQELTSLPPSVRGVMDSRRASGEARALTDRLLVEMNVPVDAMVQGARKLIVRINQPQKATLPESDQLEGDTVFYIQSN